MDKAAQVTVAANAIPLDDLVVYAANSRTHDDDQLAYVEKLMREFGWTNPILARGNDIVAGHGRRLAAQRIYASGDLIKLPDGRPLPFGTGLVLDVTGWSDAQLAAYVIADNRSAELAGWDADVLRSELQSLDGLSFDLALTGFPDLESLDSLLANLPGGKGQTREPVRAGQLAEAFGVPPFTVLNARDGWWKERKRAWLALGIQSELGRGETPGSSLMPTQGMPNARGGQQASALQGRRDATVQAPTYTRPAPPTDPQGVTPVSEFDGWWCKREDLAAYVSDDMPTGAKVRQFLKMAADQPGAPMMVGCSGDSAMQVYIAAAAKITGRRGIVYVPGRKTPSAATQYAKDMGAEVVEVRPGHLSVVKSRARERAKEFPDGIVKWNPRFATADTMGQLANLPADVRRIVVPTGTGAICAGLLAGLAEADRADVTVVAVSVSDLADRDGVLANAAKASQKTLPQLEWVRHQADYETPVFASLPDGTPLDPYYAAKALAHVQPGDCLWASGLRPQAAFPPAPKSKATATSYQSQDSLNALMKRGGKGVSGSVRLAVGQGGGLADAMAPRKGLGATPTNLGNARPAEKGLTFGQVPSYDGADRSLTTGTSVFDPVLTELSYRWFCPPGGLILDPFAGGSVRGLVAAWLGRSYLGGDLSGRQIDANREQADRLLGDERRPVWVQGDSRTLEANLTAAGHDQLADMVFTCPPYADLEVYSDDPSDLSNMPYADFLAGYRQALAQACARLRADRFAVVVVGEVRDAKGIYRNFVGDTVEAMRAAGMGYYNEAILVTAVGSLPVRAGKQFTAGRKMGKTHQNVLVFVKGDPRKATKACGPVEFGEIAPDSQDEG